jgi:ubiquitin carboxyl-terminal hydrolase 47
MIDIDGLNNDVEHFIKDGPHVYELYSILIHSGTASGGHYYAYIKSFENAKWYNFNDSSVTQITVDNFENICGGDSKSSTTAYILMYRLISNNNQIISIDETLISPELKHELEIENEKIKEEERVEKEKASNITIRLKFGKVNKDIPFKNYFTIKELKLRAMKELEVQSCEKNVRLRVIDTATNRFLESFPAEEFSLEESNLTGYKVYSLEIRENEEIPFEEFDPTAINLQVYYWDDINNEIEEKEFKFHQLVLSKNTKLSSLKEKIYEILKIDKTKEIYCFKKLEYSTPELFNASSLLNKEICQNSIYDNTKIFVELKNEDWKGSLFLKVIYFLIEET